VSNVIVSSALAVSVATSSNGVKFEKTIEN
jgi:hypothetical protein